jgi:two-component system, NtrC family, nitrogen regulation response regulator NtrX
MTMASDILIVDDEADIRELVAGILQDEGYNTRTARDSDDAITSIRSRRPNLVFLDIWLQGSRLDGLQLLDSLKGEHPDLPVVMISGHGNIETAVAAIKQGAYDFIEKPFKADRLVLVADRALETSRLKREVKELKQLTPLATTLIGHSPAVNQLRQTIEKVSPTNSRILIVGPPGAGKELSARTIHAQSARSGGPFVVINAAAITPERMEIELFGVEQSNGAQARKVGALEEAHGGTLFIDEIGDMPRETQNKILRVLVDQTFQRVGGSTKVVVDVRIVSSTSRNIEADIAAGRFREDLYHRLSVVPFRVPALAERRDDIPVLIDHFMDQISQATGLPKRQIGEDAMAVLQSHDWPGNVRQLRNNVERLMILAGGAPEAVISASMLPQDVGSMVPSMPAGNGGEHLMGMPLRDAREAFEREYLKAQISRFGGNISRTAEFVGMERSALHRKLKALGMD